MQKEKKKMDEHVFFGEALASQLWFIFHTCMTTGYNINRFAERNFEVVTSELFVFCLWLSQCDGKAPDALRFDP